jgi:transposase InsO family protein
MALMDVIRESEAQGASRQRICELLQLEERRARRWFRLSDLADGKPGPVQALHALLPEEYEAILEMARSEEYADYSHRILAAKGVDAGCFAASASSVYRVMRSEGMTMDRSGRAGRTGRSRKPDRPELTEPNQRWCWDISYVRTFVRGVFMYLYAMLDEYSRKVVAFRISWDMNYLEGMELVDAGLEKEALTKEQVEVLSLYNDLGAQMKAKAFMRMLEGLGISQRFSRTRTPNDNPFIESLFSTTKGAPNYPGEFLYVDAAQVYFTAYFDHYNNERLHGKIGYVTPVQRHTGADKEILALRKQRRVQARLERVEHNRILAKAAA